METERETRNRPDLDNGVALCAGREGQVLYFPNELEASKQERDREEK